MGAYDNLDKFNLASHGDRREQQWAHAVQQHFPAYEIFWRRYVVPLTNRIDPQASFSSDRDSWIRLRDGVRGTQERMAMHHYSVFYFLARASERIQAGKEEYPEDIFSLLDACGDNALKFFKAIRPVLKDLGARVDFVPVQKGELCGASERSKHRGLRGGLVEVQEYRDSILHNPVLGRGIQVSREFLPKRDVLERVRLSWREAGRLKPEELIGAGELYSRLLVETATFLQETWGLLLDALNARRETDKFKKQWTLDKRFLPVAEPQEIATTNQPISASGACNVSYSSTAVAVRAPSSTLSLPGPDGRHDPKSDE